MATFAGRERYTAFQWDGRKRTLKDILKSAPNDSWRERVFVKIGDNGTLAIGRRGPYGRPEDVVEVDIGDYVFFAAEEADEFQPMPWHDLMPKFPPAMLWFMSRERFESMFRNVEEEER